MKALIAYFVALLLAGILLACALTGAGWPRCSVGVSRGFYTVSVQGWCIYP